MNVQRAEIDWPQGERAIQRVLLVDDSRAQRHLLSTHLRRWGYHVAEAATGTEALQYCRVNHVDLVLSDWIMPGMNGIEFCRAFRKQNRTSYGYFILLTSKSEKAAVAEGLDVGADDFLSKQRFS
jgi:sigma-B regulation protein RsbU (phosphoserine phosphatase)